MTKNTEAVLEKLNHEWVLYHHPEIAEAIEADINDGETPSKLKGTIFKSTRRIDLAARVESAARYLVMLKQRG